MIYNNPPSYRTDVTPAMLAGLADIDTIVAFKDSSGDTRRIVDVRNMTGDRFIPFCGLDDVVLETRGARRVGWVSGMSNVFPREGETLFRLVRDRRFDEAMAIYDWFMPILHLDARSDLVQAIKYCEKIIGRGTELTRAPRLASRRRREGRARSGDEEGDRRPGRRCRKSACRSPPDRRSGMRVAVIGAGIVGVAIAHALLDEGHAVDLIDREGIAAGASAGNAGWIAHIDIMPLASPKVWRHLPALGARSARATRDPARLSAETAALARALRRGQPAKPHRSLDRGHRGAERPRPARLGDAAAKRSASKASSAPQGPAFGLVERAHGRPRDPLIARQRRMGIPVDGWTRTRCKQLEPALRSPCRRAARSMHTGCHVSDPRDLTLALGRRGIERGAAVAQDGGGRPPHPMATTIAIRTSLDSIALYDRVVVAAGAWSKPLAASIGDPSRSIPSAATTSRLPAGRLGLSRPVMFEGEGFVDDAARYRRPDRRQRRIRRPRGGAELRARRCHPRPRLAASCRMRIFPAARAGWASGPRSRIRCR